jgi:hypothetical protein
MKTVLVQKRVVDWYRNQGRLIRIIQKTSVGCLIEVADYHM